MHGLPSIKYMTIIGTQFEWSALRTTPRVVIFRRSSIVTLTKTTAANALTLSKSSPCGYYPRNCVIVFSTLTRGGLLKTSSPQAAAAPLAQFLIVRTQHRNDIPTPESTLGGGIGRGEILSPRSSRLDVDGDGRSVVHRRS